ncbi:hypothetical protein LTR17_011131 [Elasticomyces elasticus]|nr:hypothetical protein LTR17_011131 [Elasticomyces elasticus]
MTAISRKRKRTKAAKSPWPLSTATGTVATDQKADATLPSLLLDLPPELRNLVYEFVFASTGGVHLSPKAHRKHLACGSALNRVNKQVRHEFLTVGELVVDIHTSAPNFDFRHIVAFLNRLSDQEIQALPSLAVPVQRKVIVDLQPSSFFNLGLQCEADVSRALDQSYRTSHKEGHAGEELVAWAGQMPEGRSKQEVWNILDVLRRSGRGRYRPSSNQPE